MADALMDALGGRLDLQVRYGSDMPTLVLDFDEAGVAVDLSALTLSARARTVGPDPVNLAMTVGVADVATGRVTLDMSHIEINKMKRPSNLAVKPMVGAMWVMDSTDGAGRKTALLYGQILVGGTA